MPIFDDLAKPREVWPADARWPYRRATALLRRFQTAFPDLHYDLFWETRLVNAQAFIGLPGRCVRLYGGLGRHRRVGFEGLALALAHETGHHLGGPPRHPYYTSLSSEERADEWALAVGLPAVFGAAVAERCASRGRLQLGAIWRRMSQYS
jgi:hypothetical protein